MKTECESNTTPIAEETEEYLDGINSYKTPEGGYIVLPIGAAERLNKYLDRNEIPHRYYSTVSMLERFGIAPECTFSVHGKQRLYESGTRLITCPDKTHDELVNIVEQIYI